LFGTSTAGLYVFFAVIPITYVTLLVAVVLVPPGMWLEFARRNLR
jgi:hypothetical protein